MTVNKGDVVKVVAGKSAGISGKVVWAGISKFGKARVGVDTPTGVVWVGMTEIALDGPVPAAAAPVAVDLEARIVALEDTVAELVEKLAAVNAVVEVLAAKANSLPLDAVA